MAHPRLPDSAWLLPGRLAAPARPVVVPLQRVARVVLLPLACVGLVAALRRTPRAALVLLALPVYFLLTEAPFVLEWRVVVPMHLGVAAFAGVGVATLAEAVQRLRTSRLPEVP